MRSRPDYALGIRQTRSNRRGLGIALVVLVGLLTACGDTATTNSAGVATTTTEPGRAVTGELTTSDGYRYGVTVVVEKGSATGSPDCPATAVAGKVFLPVTLTVVNRSADRAVPLPPLRIEMTAAPGTKPAQVLVRDPSGACTFTPKVPQIAPGASAVFRGSTPAIDEGAAAGTAGRIQVSVSENSFSLVSPVP